jgi:ribosomal protein L2
VSFQQNNIAKISRAAGTFCKLKKKNLNSTIIELSSGKLKTIASQCFATIGVVSNELFFLTKLTKAGQA